ncbi:MAG: hypothetical protein ABIJ72_03980 [bacterium]
MGKRGGGICRIYGQLLKMLSNQTEKWLNWKVISLVSVIILATYRFYIISWQFKFYHLLVPPSPDLAAHLNMTDMFINGTAKLGFYPPLLHIIAAFFAKAFHVGSLDFFNFIAPFWIPLAIIVFYILVCKLFDYKIAFWSTLVFAFVSSSPLLNFGDAQYADILGYNLVGPFYIIALISLMRNFKYWKLILMFLLFGLFLSAHNFSSVLIYIVSFLSVIIYCLTSYKIDKTQFKNSFFVLISLCVGTVLFLTLSKIFFGPLIPRAVESLVAFNPLIKNSTAAVLDYNSISTLLPPFLEFTGLLGIAFLLLRISRDKSRFSSIFVIVWIVTIWLFSRSSLFVLPQRIFREIPLPLSIASGILISDLLPILKNNWYKIGFIALFGYLVIINNSQVAVSPFLIPDGFKNQVWFRDIDQQKYEYIVANVNKSDKILANFSNPILRYKLNMAGYGVSGFASASPNNPSASEKEEFVTNKISASGARYLFIGVIPFGVNPEVYFSQFVEYENSTKLLNLYKYQEKDLVKEFADGSKLILIN